MPARSAMVTRLLRSRQRAQPAIAAPLEASLRRGWRRLRPVLARLNKAESDPVDAWGAAWVDDFEAAFVRGLEAGAASIVEAQAEAWALGGQAVDLDPVAMAKEYYAQLGEQITGDPGATTLERTRDAIRWWREDAGRTLDDLVERLEPWYGGDRARLIAVNETTRLVSFTTRATMGRLGLGEWTWQSRLEWNTCEQCRGLHGQRFKISDPMPPDGSHVGCYCVAAAVI